MDAPGCCTMLVALPSPLLVGARLSVAPARDASDIAALFERQGPMVYRRALRLLGNAADAEEATQDIFIRVMKGLERFDGRAQVTTWLYQVTTHHCLNRLRDARRRTELADAQGPANEAHDAKAEALSTLRQLLRDADPREAEAAVFVFVDGMSHDEAAEVLGVSRRTVGNLLERFTRWAQERTSGPAEVKAS